mgnify:CR=1 FL=1
MRKKLIASALLSAVSGTVFITDSAVATEKKIECVRKLPDETYQNYPLKYQKDCDIPLQLGTPPTETTTPPGGSYSS